MITKIICFLQFSLIVENMCYSKYLAQIKNIVHLKMKICCSFTHPQVIQDARHFS